jgi:radical SAM superfamily enzyme YgiQ (UPF0313 family)
MGKPHHDVYVKFEEKYNKLNERYGKKQFLVPYLISSHPGSTLSDAVRLAEYLNKKRRSAGAGAGFLPDAGNAFHLHVLHRARPENVKARICPKVSPRKINAAGTVTVETA